MIFRHHKTTISLAAACLAALFMAPGCGEKSQPSIGVPQRAVYSSRDFDSGRKDGRRDAKDSLFDHSGAWMWVWMMSEDYAAGYQQGWTEGRNEVSTNSQVTTSRNRLKDR